MEGKEGWSLKEPGFTEDEKEVLWAVFKMTRDNPKVRAVIDDALNQSAQRDREYYDSLPWQEIDLGTMIQACFSWEPTPTNRSNVKFRSLVTKHQIQLAIKRAFDDTVRQVNQKEEEKGQFKPPTFDVYMPAAPRRLPINYVSSRAGGWPPKWQSVQPPDKVHRMGRTPLEIKPWASIPLVSNLNPLAPFFHMPLEAHRLIKEESRKAPFHSCPRITTGRRRASFKTFNKAPPTIGGLYGDKLLLAGVDSPDNIPPHPPTGYTNVTITYLRKKPYSDCEPVAIRTKTVATNKLAELISLVTNDKLNGRDFTISVNNVSNNDVLDIKTTISDLKTEGGVFTNHVDMVMVDINIESELNFTYRIFFHANNIGYTYCNDLSHSKRIMELHTAIDILSYL